MVCTGGKEVAQVRSPYFKGTGGMKWLLGHNESEAGGAFRISKRHKAFNPQLAVLL